MIRYFKVSAEAQDFIIGESRRMAPRETGGMLIGKIELDCVTIEVATGPGPEAEHKPHRFKRDGVYSQKILNDVVQKTNGEFDYLGEWHSHPQNSGPSILDVKSMLWVARNPDYHVQDPILLLCIREKANCWTPRVYVLRKGLLQMLVTP